MRRRPGRRSPAAQSRLSRGAAGSPRRPPRRPRRRRAARRARRSAPPSRYARRFDSYAARSARCPASGHGERLLVDPAGDQHQPLDGAGHEAVVGGERRGRRPARRARPPPPAGAGAIGSATSRVGQTAQPGGGRGVPGPAEQLGVHRAGTGQRVQPGERLERRPAQQRRQRRAARSRPAPRPAAIASPSPARTCARRRRRALQHRAGVGPAQQRLAGQLGRGATQSAVAQHRVDPVAGARRTPRPRPPGRAVPPSGSSPMCGTLRMEVPRDRRVRARLMMRAAGRRAPGPVACQQWTSSFSTTHGPSGPVAAAYDRGRPAYPRDAAAWLVGREAAEILELGAGTGKLTTELVALGHDVHATDPDEAMLEVLRERVPGVRTSVGTAEEHRRPATGRSTSSSPRRPSTGSTWTGPCPRSPGSCKPGGRARPGLEPARRADPVGAPAGRASSTPRTSCASPPRPLVESELFGFVEERDVQDLAGRQPGDHRRPGAAPARTSRCSTRTPGRRSSPRCWRSTTTTAAAWTACSCPT